MFRAAKWLGPVSRPARMLWAPLPPSTSRALHSTARVASARTESVEDERTPFQRYLARRECGEADKEKGEPEPSEKKQDTKWDPFFRAQAVAHAISLAGLFYYSAEKHPVTGQWRLMLPMLRPEPSKDVDLQEDKLVLGGEVYTRLTAASDLAVRSKAMAEQILQAAGVREQDCEVVILDLPHIAHSMLLSGRLLALSSGYLDQCENDDELSTVLGHEIAKRVCQPATQAASTVFTGALGFTCCLQGAITGTTLIPNLVGIPAIAYWLSGEPYLVDADRAGVNFAAAAGFDVLRGTAVWTQMAEMMKEPEHAPLAMTLYIGRDQRGTRPVARYRLRGVLEHVLLLERDAYPGVYPEARGAMLRQRAKSLNDPRWNAALHLDDARPCGA